MYRHPMQRPLYHHGQQPSPRRKQFPKYRYIIGSLILTSVIMLATTVGMTLWNSGHAAKASAGTFTGLTNLGMPSAPQPVNPADFAFTKHFRQTSQTSINNGYGPPADGGNTPLAADHGADCSAPPATHPIGTSYANLVFVCHDHMMTALSSDHSGYGEIVFQPNQLVDFSDGSAATVSISMSTQRTSDRDWVDFNFTPFSQQLAYPVDPGFPDGQGMPLNDVQVQMCSPHDFAICVHEYVNGTGYKVNGDSFTTVGSLTPPSKTVRTPISMTISQTHIKIEMAGHVFYDTNFPKPLPFSQSVFQVTHHSYTPSKDGGVPDTWHWSNLTISRALPYFLEAATPDAAGDYAGYGLGSTITLPTPAPAGAFLRMQAYYGDVQASFDGGTTWHTVSNQPSTNPSNAAHNIWLPVPQGTTTIKLRGARGWYARDFYVMALTPSSTILPPTGSAPTATSSSQQPTAPGSTQLQNTPCMITVNGAMVNGTCTGSFTPSQ